MRTLSPGKTFRNMPGANSFSSSVDRETTVFPSRTSIPVGLILFWSASKMTLPKSFANILVCENFCHWRRLQELALHRVHDQITKVVTIMKLCDSMDEFRQKFSRLFNKSSQMAFTFATR